jgi:DNA anti-recombination protein RmuC
MQKDIEALSDLVLKIKRLETALSAKIDRFVESEQAIADYKKELTLEIEELKLFKKSLPKLITSSMKESSSEELPKILPSLIKSFKENTLDFTNASIKEADRLKNEINKTVWEAKHAMSSGKKELTLRSMGITLDFCLS